MNVSGKTTAKLEAYLDLLNRWSPRINLVSPASLVSGWDRHIEDSLQLVSLRADPGQSWADLGSGGGLPAMVVAIALEDSDTRFTLVEADQRKATFLRQAVRVLQLPRVSVLSERIERAAPLDATTLSARALAPLPKLMTYVSRHLAPEGTALLPKGRSWREEVTEAQQRWTFDLTVHSSVTDAEAAILEIGNIHAH